MSTSLYVDWCASWDIEPLGADAHTVLRFLRECPAAPATLARRVREINVMHERAGLPAPGHDEAIRGHIRAMAGQPVQPATRFDTTRVMTALAQIPVHAWPRALAGRRDAAVLALVCLGGLTRRQVCDLALGLLRVDESAVRGLPGPVASLERTDVAAACPVCAYTRWLRLARCGHATGWRGTREWLAGEFDTMGHHPERHDCERPLPTTAPYAGRPLFTGFDQHGWPLRQPLSTRSVTTIIATRLRAADDADAPGAGEMPASGTAERHGGQPGRELYEAMESLLDEFEERLSEVDRDLQDALGELDRSTRELRQR
ncbi:hypothetical protein EF847_11315 [Actinobacteria bacterium YIM 96077]|uniref:Integrase n=1 Tax=Phytoactinopolyspora halophila TaxID=1981511 RepID=A0A329R257_9ACTN|nr:hypothetical protein [Phytoactinopolyspora halophila]AYY13199.1 hypothetical protein EF847_11315 [Actinobacteria bacterium YIM 96077]RAW17562.1 hypothetical protein DPM12_06105 [Phytoactinopolyspora halophila]